MRSLVVLLVLLASATVVQAQKVGPPIQLAKFTKVDFHAKCVRRNGYDVAITTARLINGKKVVDIEAACPRRPKTQ